MPISAGPINIKELISTLNIKEVWIGGTLYFGTGGTPPVWDVYLPLVGQAGSVFDLEVSGVLFQDITGIIPVTASGQPCGMVIGKSNSNPLPLRTNFAAWTQDYTKVVATEGTNGAALASVLAPDGTMTALSLNENAANSTHSYGWQSWNVQSGTQYTVSVYGRAEQRQWLQLNISDGDAWKYATFDILNGVVGLSAGSVTNMAIEDVGGGWFRCSATISTGGGSGGIGIDINHTSAIKQPTQGESGFGFDVWGMQVNAGPVATAYQRIDSPYGSWLPPSAFVLYSPNTASRPLYVVESGVKKIRFDGVSNQYLCASPAEWGQFTLLNAIYFPDSQGSTRMWWYDGVSPEGFNSWFRGTPVATNYINGDGGNAGPTFPVPATIVSRTGHDANTFKGQVNDNSLYSRASTTFTPNTQPGFVVGAASNTTFYIGDWMGGVFIDKYLDTTDMTNYKDWLYTTAGITP